MPARIYIETSIVSYLAARPNRDVVSAARQQQTHDWWLRRRADYSLFASNLVLREAADGHPEAAARRMNYLSELPVLEIDAQAFELAEVLLDESGLPAKAAADALHIAVAARHGMEFLLTWNMKHIANAEFRPSVEAACRSAGLEPPTLCTPDSLLGD